MQSDQKRLDRLTEQAVIRGAAQYDRRQVLPRIFDTITCGEIDDESEAGTTIVCKRLQLALKAEQSRIQLGHWTASPTRCMAIRQALHAEREALARLQSRAAA